MVRTDNILFTLSLKKLSTKVLLVSLQNSRLTCGIFIYGFGGSSSSSFTTQGAHLKHQRGPGGQVSHSPGLLQGTAGTPAPSPVPSSPAMGCPLPRPFPIQSSHLGCASPFPLSPSGLLVSWLPVFLPHVSSCGPTRGRAHSGLPPMLCPPYLHTKPLPSTHRASFLVSFSCVPPPHKGLPA